MATDRIRWTHALFLPTATTLQAACWRPAVDIYRRGPDWLVKVDVAGVRPQDVTISVRGHSLMIRGCRRDWSASEGHAHYQMEITYSQFERCLELPCDLEAARLVTEYREGMLLIRIQSET